MSRIAKDLVTILIFVFWTILISFVLLTVCRADELKYRIDYETCLYDMLHADSNNDDWTTAKVYRAINMGITFVEGVSKANEVQDTLSFCPTTDPVDTALFYSLSADAATGGVLSVLYVDGEHNELIALTKRKPEDFGKDKLQTAPGATRTYMFAEFKDTIMVYPRPDVDYVMHILSYKVSDWLSEDSSEVALPLFHRLLALDMAYGYAQLMTGTQAGFSRYSEIRNNVLTALYAVPPAPAVSTQSLGIEGQ